MADTLPELVEREVEVISSSELNMGAVDHMIAVSKKLPQMAEAIKAIRQFGLSATLPGDFVRFGDKVELTGPGAGRVISAIGHAGVSVNFTDWKYNKDTGTDKNGDHYQWWYSASFEIGCIRGLALGRAGSRDLFFGKEKGQWKDLSEVREADIRFSAYRGVFKEALKIAFGLRGIPFDSCAALGIDVSKVKSVEFGSSKNGTAASGASDEFIAKIVKAGVKRKTETYTVYAVSFNNNVTAETFEKKIADKAFEFQKSGVEVFVRTSAAKNEKYAPKLDEIMTATDDHRKMLAPKDPETPKDKGADAAGDAQE